MAIRTILRYPDPGLKVKCEPVTAFDSRLRALAAVLLDTMRAAPGIGITALFSFMTAYNEFILASVFLDDVTRYTLPVTLQQSVGGFDPDWGVFAAGSLLLSIPVVLVFFFVQRQMVQGLTAGAVKG